MAILSKSESPVMWAVYDLARNKSSALITREDIMARVKPVRRLAKKAHKEGIAEAEFLTAENDLPIVDEDGNPYVPEKPKEKPRRRKKDEDGEADEEPLPEKVYIDEPPVLKGRFEYFKPVKYVDIPHILEVLEMEEFIELTEARADGETQYVVELCARGRRWERDERDRKRGTIIKYCLMTVTPILSFFFGLILKFIT